MNDRYTDCLSLDDLARIRAAPLPQIGDPRLLPQRRRGSAGDAYRRPQVDAAYLQDDRILTLTASEGHEEAAEDRDARLGRFTARLIERPGRLR